MFFLSRFSVRTKILLIPLIGATGFAFYLLLSIQSSLSNAALLENIRTVRVPALQLADRLVVKLERFTEALGSAATAGDADMIDGARGVAEGIAKDIAELPSLEDALATPSRELERAFKSYSDAALSLSTDMVSGNLDYSLAAERSKSMSAALEQYRSLLKALQDEQQSQFEDALNQAETGTENLIERGLLLGGAMIVLLFAVAVPVSMMIKGSLSDLIATLRDIGQENGDLTARLKRKSGDEFGELVDCFNQFIGKLHQTISSVVSATDPVSDAADNVRRLSDEGHKSIADQRARTFTTSSSVQEMSASSLQIAQNAQQAASAAEMALQETTAGNSAVAASMTQIKSLASHLDAVSAVIAKVEKDSESISSVVKIIRDVADQTNLLALNAAIESARAGEHGRGFAVVADEVRGLAAKTQQSTVSIVEIIERLRHASNEAVEKAQEANTLAERSVEGSHRTEEALARIRGSIETITEMNMQIAAATGQQKQVSESIVDDVAYIEDKAEISATHSENLKGVSQKLADSVSLLRSVSSRFRL